MADPTPSESDRIGRLYEAYADTALRLATALTGDAEAGADIVQTAFVRLLARFRDLRDPGSFYSYLRATIVNLVRDRARRNVLERLIVRRHPEDIVQPDLSIEVGSHDFIVELLRKLPQRQRTVLVLRYFEDLSETEVAGIMGLSVSAVKSLTHRAMTTLRASLGDDHEEEP